MKIGTKIRKYVGQNSKRWINWSAQAQALKEKLMDSSTAREVMKRIEHFEKITGKTLRIQHEHDINEKNEMPPNAKAMFSPKKMRIVFKGGLENLSKVAVAVSEELDHAKYNFESPGSLGYDGIEIYKAEKRGKETLHRVREELEVGPIGFAQWNWDTLLTYVRQYHVEEWKKGKHRKVSKEEEEEEALKFIREKNLRDLL